MRTTMYEIRRGNDRKYTATRASNYESAMKTYEKYIRFSKSHRLTTTVALMKRLENGDFSLVKSVNVNS